MDMTLSARVPMEVQWCPSWLTWVGATTSCLRALGCDVDMADVAGLSGYAFMVNVDDTLCPSGPTAFPWSSLTEGIPFLGRSVLHFRSLECYEPSSGHTAETALGHCRAAFEITAAEVQAGRPCVIWGAYVPELAVAYGVEQGCYLVKSFRQCSGEPEEPIPWDKLEAPGGPNVMAFPTPTSHRVEDGDRFALSTAVERLRPWSPTWDGRPGHVSGLAAYDAWVSGLTSDRAVPFGAAYNAQCWAEGRRLAAEYVAGVAARHPEKEALADAAGAYADAARAMGRVAELFPFRMPAQPASEEAVAQAAEALRAAKESEARAANSIAQVVAGW
jgi:hypothetical protein